MANPRLQLRRGTAAPASVPVTTALAGEPFFDTTGDNFYIADSASTFVHIGGGTYTSRVDSFLTERTTTVASIVTLKEAINNGNNNVSLKAPALLASDVTFQLPNSNGTNGFYLKTDGNGITSWEAVPSGSFTVAGDSGTPDTFTTGGTLTFAGTDPIDTAITNDTVTISAKDATTTTKGVASFSSTDFTVTSGAVSINAESIQDTVGAMVSTNTESGIAVTYDDTNGKLDFNVDDFTITLGGDLSGSVTITNLASATLTATVAADSVALGTDTTGQYASTITGGAGLTATTAGADNGTAYTIAVGAGEGIVVNADDVALKNGTNLTDATVMGWDNTNNQLTNSPITYTGNDVAITGDLTVTGNDIKSSGGTTAITLSGANVTIAGDLTVSGATTTLNTASLLVEDRIVELGLVNNTAPSASTTWDLAVAFNYNTSNVAKKSAIVWVNNAGFELAATLGAEDNTGAAEAQPQIAPASYASLGVASLFIGALATPENEVITASKTITNVTIDCGSY